MVGLDRHLEAVDCGKWLQRDRAGVVGEHVDPVVRGAQLLGQSAYVVEDREVGPEQLRTRTASSPVPARRRPGGGPGPARPVPPGRHGRPGRTAAASPMPELAPVTTTSRRPVRSSTGPFTPVMARGYRGVTTPFGIVKVSDLSSGGVGMPAGRWKERIHGRSRSPPQVLPRRAGFQREDARQGPGARRPTRSSSTWRTPSPRWPSRTRARTSWPPSTRATGPARPGWSGSTT